MRKFIIPVILVFISSLSVNAQDHNYSIGLTYQPFFYKNYNVDDWNNRPYSYPDNPNTVNGYALGIVFSKAITDYFSVKSELTYSDQYQEHVTSNSSGTDVNGTEHIYYNIDIKTSYKLLKLPIIPSFEYELGYESGYFFSAGLGIQLSYLVDYLSESNVYGVEDGEIDYDSRHFYYVDKPYIAVAHVWDNSDDSSEYYLHVSREWESRKDDTYNTWLFGVVGELSLKKVLFSRYEISIGARYEYDITNSERYPGFTHIVPSNYDGGRPKTHNIRTGFSFSVAYRI